MWKGDGGEFSTPRFHSPEQKCTPLGVQRGGGGKGIRQNDILVNLRTAPCRKDRVDMRQTVKPFLLSCRGSFLTSYTSVGGKNYHRGGAKRS